MWRTERWLGVGDKEEAGRPKRNDYNNPSEDVGDLRQVVAVEVVTISDTGVRHWFWSWSTGMMRGSSTDKGKTVRAMNFGEKVTSLVSDRAGMRWFLRQPTINTEQKARCMSLKFKWQVNNRDIYEPKNYLKLSTWVRETVSETN